MAELTPLDEKIAEVLGLAQAAQQAADKVSKMEGADDFADRLKQMKQEAAETEKRTEQVVEDLNGKKTAIHEKARETKGEATEMMKTYLEGEQEALDGFEFLSMAEAGELAHWEIVEKMADTVGQADVRDLARWVLPIQRGHIETVREASLALAAEEAKS